MKRQTDSSEPSMTRWMRAIAIALAATFALPFTVHARSGAGSGSAYTVMSKGFAVIGPRVGQPGYTTIRFENNGGTWNGVAVARVVPGVTPGQVRAALRTNNPTAQRRVVTVLGGLGATSESMSVDLSPGRYILSDSVSGARGKTSVAAWFFTVAGGAQTRSAPPRATATVTMAGFRYGMPTRLPSGQVVLKIVNKDPETHEMAIFKLSAGKTAHDLVQSLQSSGSSSGPPPGDIRGGLFDEAAGHSIWLHTTLTRGNYAAISFATDSQTHRPDWLLGMVKGFTVH